MSLSHRPRSPRSVTRSGRAAQEVRQERRLRLLRGNRLSAWEPISQIIAQLLVRSWDNGWDNRRGSARDRIALKRRQRNDLVGFELFLCSQTLYPTELRARSVSPSTIPRCGAKLQLCSPDFVAHVAQLSPAPKCQPWESRSRVPPFPPILRGTSGSSPTACRTGSCLWRIVISPMIPQDSPS